MNYKVKNLCEITSSRRIFAKEYTNSGVPFFRSQEVIECSKTGHTNPTIFISKERYDSIKASGLPTPQIGDILLSAIGANRGFPWHVNIDPLYFKDGNVIWLRNFQSFCVSKYLYYYLSTSKIIYLLQTISEHSAQGAITLDLVRDLEISLPKLEIQQHIIDTIGSVDDLIENLESQIKELRRIGLIKINTFNDHNELTLLSNICHFEKGIELGSANYIDEFYDGLIHYLRVGDLLSLTNTFVDKSICKNIAKENDILIAFDGAPGRNEVGLNGAFSSGIYKVVCDEKYKGLIYFELNSIHNQKIISDHSQGTTILHASKAIQYLECIDATIDEPQYFKSLFDQIIYLEEKVNHLKTIKQTLLDKYFTNQ